MLASESGGVGDGTVVIPRPVATPSTAPTQTSATSPSAPAAPHYAPSITTSPSFTPDYPSLIQSDPGYEAAQSAATAAQQNAQAQRQASIRQAFIQYGGAPAGFKDQYGDVDQATQDAAKANTNSTLAGIHHSHDQSVEQFRKALAARGMVGSGDMNYGQQNLDRGLGQSEYDAANTFGGQVQGYLGNYAGVLNQNQGNLVNAISTAEANQYADPLNRPVAAGTARLDSDLSNQYGQAIYTDGIGNLYDQFGNPPRALNNKRVPPIMNPDGTSTPVTQMPYAPGPVDANNVPISAGFYGFNKNGEWTA